VTLTISGNNVNLIKRGQTNIKKYQVQNIMNKSEKKGKIDTSNTDIHDRSLYRIFHYAVILYVAGSS
jgi:hypothetical protein